MSCLYPFYWLVHSSSESALKASTWNRWYIAYHRAVKWLTDLGHYGLFSLPQEDDSTMWFTLQSMLTKQKAPRICVGLFSFSAPSLSLFYLPHSYAFLKEAALINLMHLNPWLWLCFCGAFGSSSGPGKNTKEFILKMAYQLATWQLQTVTEGMWNINYS